MDFLILNRDKEIGRIIVDRNRIKEISIREDSLNFLAEKEFWVEKRIGSENRYNLRELLKLARIRDLEEFIKITRCISFLDNIWLNEVGSELTWEKVNPFRNRLNNILSKVALDLEYRGGEIRTPSPDYKVAGTAEKCWRRKNGKIYLYKNAGEKYSGITGNREYIEYYVGQVVNFLGLDGFAKYNIEVKILDNGLSKAYAISEIFTTEDKGFIAFSDTKYSKLGIVELLDVLDKRGKVRILSMLLIDSIVFNIDRHDENFGFELDNNKLEIVGISKIYDFDCSLGYNITLGDKGFEDWFKRVVGLSKPRTVINDKVDFISQGRFAIDELEKLGFLDIRRRLKDLKWFKFKEIKRYNRLEAERLQYMNKFINRIAEIL